MKLFVAVCLLVAYLVAFMGAKPIVSVFEDGYHPTQVQDMNLIKSINSVPGLTWKARPYARFANMTIMEMKSKLMGAILPLEVYPKQERKNLGTYKPSINLPDNFDGRKVWPKCIHPVRDQQHCGSCWAFSASEVMSDRFCIASNGTVDIVFSPQDMVSCDKLNQGCNGGILPLVWHYMKHTGVVSDQCFPYVSGGGDVPSCPSTCVDGSSFSSQKRRVSDYYHVGGGIIHFGDRSVKIQEELVKHGSIQTGFQVYRDFLSYASGVYKHTSGGLLGGHAVEIVGYGVEADGTKYWTVKNSWNTTWGEQGYFRILRGTNECGFEADAYAGLPLLK